MNFYQLASVRQRVCIALKHRIIISLSILSFVIPGSSAQSQQEVPANFNIPMIKTYSQSTLLKNWAMSVCLAKTATDEKSRADANATANAYMEFGKQPIEAYDALRKLAFRYTAKKYGGSVKSDYNTMKCIDLYNSNELKTLVKKLVKTK